jgi:hypothetical protein
MELFTHTHTLGRLLGVEFVRCSIQIGFIQMLMAAQSRPGPQCRTCKLAGCIQLGGELVRRVRKSAARLLARLMFYVSFVS